MPESGLLFAHAIIVLLWNCRKTTIAEFDGRNSSQPYQKLPLRHRLLLV